MLFAVSGLMDCPVEASDGEVGSVKDFLFDDQTWKIRWMAVEAGPWLAGRRRVFIHPSAIAPLELPPRPTLPMMSSPSTLQLSVNLTRAQIAGGPHAHEDQPVTKDMEALLYDYYGSDPYWGASHSWHATGPTQEVGGSSATRRGATRTSRPQPSTARDHPRRGLDHGLSCSRARGRHRPCRERTRRRRQLGDPLSGRRDAKLVAGEGCPTFALCGEGHRWFGRRIVLNVSPRSGEVGPGPARGDRRRERGTAPPFRLAGPLQPVGNASRRGASHPRYRPAAGPGAVHRRRFARAIRGG